MRISFAFFKRIALQAIFVVNLRKLSWISCQLDRFRRISRMGPITNERGFRFHSQVYSTDHSIIIAMNTSSSSSLPLDWTRVSRKRPANDTATSCCIGGVCRRHVQSSSALSLSDTNLRHQGQVSYHQGQVIVCLLDSNPDWFQAYLFLPDATTWGLLGIQKEIDECLQCSEGGYRVIDLKVMTSKDNIVLTDIEWTGGDMMDLKGNGVVMQASKIMTGPDAVPILEGVFSGLMQKVRSSCAGETAEVVDPLQVFPELAIVVGNMQLCLPQETSLSAMDAS